MTKLTDHADDAKLAGTILREAGPNFLLVVSNLMLTALVVFVITYGVIGPDRWTSVDHAEYARKADEREKEHMAKFEDRGTEIVNTRTDIKVMNANLKNVQANVQEIKDMMKAKQ